jgi:mannitol-1-phosphate 5-dehydrogenase
MKKVIHFGAGNIGRGFFGELYYDSNWEILFADVSRELVSLLNQEKKYPLWIVGDKTVKRVIDRFSACLVSDEKTLQKAIADTNLISFSVGANNVRNLAPIFARLIEAKFSMMPDSTLDFIIGENLKNGAVLTKEWIISHLNPAFMRFFHERVGFVETVLSRMVPIVPDDLRKEYPLLVMVEEYRVLPLQRKAFIGPVPEISGFLPVDDIEPYQAMKLSIHNFSHSAFAYAGFLHGHTYIWESVNDLEIAQRVDAAMNEIIPAIASRYGRTKQELEGYYSDLLKRFCNRALGDTIFRVAREPIRKLGANERFIATARLCLSQGINPENVAYFAACAFKYKEPRDPESVRLGQLLASSGTDAVLKEICALEAGDPLAALIKEQFRDL